MSGSERCVGPLLALLATRPLAPDPQAAPTLITVPAALQRRSATLEPSGVVWAPTLHRYLVVSDDTGDAANHHQPWVLAMTVDGAFDEAPVPLLGLDELNDAESICAGPAGLFFLVTSHAPNKRGHESPARQLLLLLRPEGRALRVEGRVDLTTARAADGGGSLLQLAGLPVDGRLDIEAITFREGALLIGLKSPLSARDGAVALRLSAPVEALRAGRIPPGAVRRAWEVSLSVGERGIPEGLADFTSLPDGTMALVANAPKGRAPDHGGALYWYHPKTGAVRLLRHFQELHPEGVTLAPDGKSLVLVFDNNTGPPLWMRWPLPLSGPR
jgi:hypothetical protein